MLRLPSFSFLQPKTLHDALMMKGDAGPDGMYVAGGTDLYPNMKRRHQEPKTVISLMGIPELRTAGRPDGRTARAVLAYCFDTVLRLLHPVVPFITEELWQKLPMRKPGELLAVAPWPAPRPELEDPRADQDFARVKTAIEHIRSIRAEYRVPPKTRLRATIVARGNDRAQTFEGERETIVRLAQLESLALDGAPQAAGAHAVFGDGSEVVVALEGAVDLRVECKRLSEEMDRLDQQLKGLAARLTNESFVARAPQDVVAREREKERAWRDQRDILAGKLKSLGCS